MTRVRLMRAVRNKMGRAVALTTVLAIGLAACGSSGSDDAATTTTVAGGATGGKLRVATTVAPITSIVANVGGDRVAVTGIVPEGTNSHTFEPRPSDAKALTDAQLIIINGLQLEEPTKELAEANKPEGTALVELGNLSIPEAEWIYDFSFPKEEGKPNPHLWTNPPLVKRYAQIVADELTKLDPAGKDVFSANLTAYLAKVDALDAAMKTAFTTIPAENRKLLTYHDAYAYFGRDYGWTIIGAIQVSDFEDPTAKEVADLIEQVKSEKVPAIFGSEVFPSPVLEQIGKEAGVRYIDELRDDDLPGEPGGAGHSLLGLLKFNFATMTTALGGDPAALEALTVTDTATPNATYPQ